MLCAVVVVAARWAKRCNLERGDVYPDLPSLSSPLLSHLLSTISQAQSMDKLDRSILDTERFIIIEQQVLQGSVAMAAAQRRSSKGGSDSNALIRQAELGIDQSKERLEFLRGQLEKKKRRRMGAPKVEEKKWNNQLGQCKHIPPPPSRESPLTRSMAPRTTRTGRRSVAGVSVRMHLPLDPTCARLSGALGVLMSSAAHLAASDGPR